MYEHDKERDISQNRPGDLKMLGEMKDWTIAPDKPDIRGWKLVDIEGKDYGKIDDLLVDDRSGEAIFGVLSHGELLGLGGKRTLVPLDMVRVDRDKDLVKFSGSPDLLKDAPAYSRDTHDFNGFYDYWSSRSKGMEESELRHKWASTDDRGRLLSEKLEEQYYKHHQEETNIGKTEEEGTAIGSESGKIGRIPVIRKGEEAIEGVSSGQTVIHEGETIEIPVVGERTVVTGKVVIEAKTQEEELEEEES